MICLTSLLLYAIWNLLNKFSYLESRKNDLTLKTAPTEVLDIQIDSNFKQKSHQSGRDTVKSSATVIGGPPIDEVLQINKVVSF